MLAAVEEDTAIDTLTDQVVAALYEVRDRTTRIDWKKRKRGEVRQAAHILLHYRFRRWEMMVRTALGHIFLDFNHPDKYGDRPNCIMVGFGLIPRRNRKEGEGLYLLNAEMRLWNAK